MTHFWQIPQKQLMRSLLLSPAGETTDGPGADTGQGLESSELSCIHFRQKLATTEGDIRRLRSILHSLPQNSRT